MNRGAAWGSWAADSPSAAQAVFPAGDALPPLFPAGFVEPCLPTALRTVPTGAGGERVRMYSRRIGIGRTNHRGSGVRPLLKASRKGASNSHRGQAHVRRASEAESQRAATKGHP
jgi:hypothetical protein